MKNVRYCYFLNKQFSCNQTFIWVSHQNVHQALFAFTGCGYNFVSIAGLFVKNQKKTQVISEKFHFFRNVRLVPGLVVLTWFVPLLLSWVVVNCSVLQEGNDGKMDIMVFVLLMWVKCYLYEMTLCGVKSFGDEWVCLLQEMVLCY